MPVGGAPQPPRARRIRAFWPVCLPLLLASTTDRPPRPTTGRIVGLAVLAPRLANRHQRVRIYAEPGGSENAPAATESPLENVVLYLQSVSRGAVPPPHPVPAMRQHGERFQPHVLPVAAGTPVEFPNDDPIYHNVFSLSSAKSFDLGRFGQGQSRTVVFPKAGIVQVFCHIHADMSGYILVLPNGFFTKPDSAGRFTLEDVPEGHYQLVAWHERIRPITVPVQVTGGATADVTVSIPLLSVSDSS